MTHDALGETADPRVHPDACDITLYRTNEQDDEEETDLGDGRILFLGAFEPPAHWSDDEREAYLDGESLDRFVRARIACNAPTGTAAHFVAEPGDYAAVVEADGLISMYYVHDRIAGERPDYVLIREELE